jgi:hypothetical protein
MQIYVYIYVGISIFLTVENLNTNNSFTIEGKLSSIYVEASVCFFYFYKLYVICGGFYEHVICDAFVWQVMTIGS